MTDEQTTYRDLPQENRLTPCANLIEEMARVCFIITVETDYDATCWWSAHVNQLHVTVRSKNNDLAAESVLEFYFYMDVVGGRYAESRNPFWTKTIGEGQERLAELKEFQRRALREVEQS